jgi:hypothetical protein
MLRLVGIVALFVTAACGQQAAVVQSSPVAVIGQGSWSQSLTLTGDLPGHITGVVPDQGTQQTYCSGAKARNGETWASTFYATVDASGAEWMLSIDVANFRGPGMYTGRDVQIALQSADNSRAWLNQPADSVQKLPADKVTFVIDRGLQSGTVDAYLTSASSGKRGAERISGTWNCRG